MQTQQFNPILTNGIKKKKVKRVFWDLISTLRPIDILHFKNLKQNRIHLPQISPHSQNLLSSPHSPSLHHHFSHSNTALASEYIRHLLKWLTSYSLTKPFIRIPERSGNGDEADPKITTTIKQQTDKVVVGGVDAIFRTN